MNSGYARVASMLLTLASLPAAADTWAPPRTAHGAPDFQGIWTNATVTTLERPDDVDHLVLTIEEADRIERASQQFLESYDEPAADETGLLPEGNDPGGYNTFWMDAGKHVAVVDGELRSSLIVEPEDGEIPYRLKARWHMFWRFLDFISQDNPEQRPLGERCMVGFGSTGGPPMLPVLYNNHYQIVQTTDTVMILVEMNQDARIIRIGGEHPPAHIRSWLGDSIGRWEGDTLVVETTNFHPGQNLRVSTSHAIFSSSDLKVTERFTLTGNGSLVYSFTMDDPAVYSSVWRGEIPMYGYPDRSMSMRATKVTMRSPTFLQGRGQRSAMLRKTHGGSAGSNRNPLDYRARHE